MDNDRAKLILSSYRPSGKDASDPFFSNALEQARLDPELNRWFTEQRSFDETMQEALCGEPIPQHLRDTLLLGNEARSKATPLRASHRQWAFPAKWQALAAAIVLFLGLAVFFHQPPTTSTEMTGPQFAQQIIQMTESGDITLGKMATDTDELRAWLASQEAPHDFSIPEKLQNLEGMGCQSFEINGSKVSLICFMLDKNQLVHLFVIDEDALEDAPGNTPSIIGKDSRIATTWSAGGRTYVTGMNVDETTLRQLI